MRCKSPYYVFLQRGTPRSQWIVDDSGVPRPFVGVRCGRCVGCRVSRSQEWSLRLLHELSTTPDHDAIFVTLTYDDDHNPLQVQKRDLQNFFKRLRKDLDHKIRYYACGEYGETTYRPHYHAIIFGLKKCAETEILLKNNWNLGLISVGTVTRHSCRYVADYTLKSLGMKLELEKRNINPPFCLMSKSIGKSYVIKHQMKILDQRHLTVGGHVISPPRTYMRWLGLGYAQIEAITQITDRNERRFGKPILTYEELDTVLKSNVISAENQARIHKLKHNRSTL